MESAAHLDVMRVEALTDEDTYRRGNELLERVVSMLTRMIDPSLATTVGLTTTGSAPFTCHGHGTRPACLGITLRIGSSSNVLV